MPQCSREQIWGPRRGSTDVRAMNVFVSYDPADGELVAAIVSVLCANNSALLCCDADTLRTGRGPRDELRQTIAESDVVLVFWCHHSFTSYDVRKESELALEQGRDILPLLLDGTPLPRKLADRRCIDLRDRVGVIHEASPDQQQSRELTERAEADRLIASDLSRQYEDLLIMGLVRDIEAELASRFGS